MSKVTSKFILATLLGTILVRCDALAFKPGFYGSTSNEVQNQIWATRDRADQFIFCEGIDKFYLHESRTASLSADPSKSFSRADLKVFLAKQSRKDLVVILCSKQVTWTSPKKLERMTREIRQCFHDVGYKRILILGAHAFGIRVLVDSSECAPKRAINSRLEHSVLIIDVSVAASAACSSAEAALYSVA
jgi:hypothetical protein